MTHDDDFGPDAITWSMRDPDNRDQATQHRKGRYALSRDKTAHEKREARRGTRYQCVGHFQ